MALTVKLEDNPVENALKVRRILATGDDSYATGGYALTASSFGFDTLHAVIVLGSTSGNVAQWDPATGKLLFFRTGTSANTALNEVAAAQDLSAVTVSLLGIGS
jgi:hypothetical protein